MHQHDDLPAFHAAYLVAAILSAAIFNVGFFLLLIAVHAALDYIKYRDLMRMKVMKSIRAVAMENMVDIALLLLALTCSVYLHHTFALAFVSGALRSTLTIARAAATIIPKFEVLEHGTGIIAHVHEYLHTPNPSLGESVLRVHHWSALTIAACVTLLLVAIPLYGNQQADLVGVLQHELLLHL